MITRENTSTQTAQIRLFNRMRLWSVTVLLLCACAVAVPGCTQPRHVPVTYLMGPDREGLLEVGQSFATASISIRLAKPHLSNTQRSSWGEVVAQAGDLLKSAERLNGDRIRALTGSRAEVEAFYAQLSTQTAALRAQREQLEADLFKLLPSPTSAPASAPSPP